MYLSLRARRGGARAHKVSNRIEVGAAPDRVHLVVRRARDFVKLFRLSRRVEKLSPHAVGNHLIVRAMNEELRAADARNLTERIHLRPYDETRNERHHLPG